MSTKNRSIRWYVFPHTPAVNNRIVYAVDGQSYAFSEESDVVLIGGKEAERPLWEVPHLVITALKNDKGAVGKFTVFSREGQGPIREFDPDKARRWSGK